MPGERFRTAAATVSAWCVAVCLGCSSPDGSTQPGASASSSPPRVRVIAPQQTTIRRTTTQPATVEAYFEADILAKASGYCVEVKHDIGDSVDQGAELAVLEVPEWERRAETEQARIRKLEADRARTTAAVRVAQAAARSAAAQLEQARAEVGKWQAQLEADQQELGRVRQLVERGSVTDRLRDEAEQRVASAQAALAAAEAAVDSAAARREVAQAEVLAAESAEQAAQAETEVARKQRAETQVMLDYRTLRAPFAGVVTERNLDPGDLVRDLQMLSGAKDRPLFRVARVDRVRVRVAIPENDAPWADAGDSATLRLRAVSGPPIEAEMTRVARRLDSSTRTMMAEIELDNPQQGMQVLPGMFGEVTLLLDEHEGLVLPAGSVAHDPEGQAYVLVVTADGTLARVDVRTGLDTGTQLEIIDGLTPESRVVATRSSELKPGVAVQVAADDR